MKLVSLKIKPSEQQKDSPACAPCDMEKPKYPWGTTLHLDEKALAKLGIKEMPAVGTEIPISAVAKVTGTSEREYESGKHQTLDLQLTDMAFGPDKVEVEPKKLYPSSADAKA